MLTVLAPLTLSHAHKTVSNLRSSRHQENSTLLIVLRMIRLCVTGYDVITHGLNIAHDRCRSPPMGKSLSIAPSILLCHAEYVHSLGNRLRP